MIHVGWWGKQTVTKTPSKINKCREHYEKVGSGDSVLSGFIG
jgi:hypothetical protein